MPSLNGDLIFGLVMSWTTEARETARQIREYPGVDGLSSLDMGTRGGISQVEGALYGVDAPSLGEAEAMLRTYQLDGGAYVAVDDYGIAWPNVILTNFRPTGPVFWVVAGYYNDVPVIGGFARKYRAQLLHLT